MAQSSVGYRASLLLVPWGSLLVEWSVTLQVPALRAVYAVSDAILAASTALCAVNVIETKRNTSVLILGPMPLPAVLGFSLVREDRSHS